MYDFKITTDSNRSYIIISKRIDAVLFVWFIMIPSFGKYNYSRYQGAIKPTVRIHSEMYVTFTSETFMCFKALDSLPWKCITTSCERALYCNRVSLLGPRNGYLLPGPQNLCLIQVKISKYLNILGFRETGWWLSFQSEWLEDNYQSFLSLWIFICKMGDIIIQYVVKMYIKCVESWLTLSSW